MPKRSKAVGRGTRRGGNDNSLIPFKFVTTFNASASGFTLSTLDLALSVMGPRLAAQITLFKKWRLVKLRIKAFIDSVATISAGSGLGTVGTTIVSGFYGGSSTNAAAAPSSIAEVASLLHSDLGQQRLSYVVPKKTLHESQNSDWMLCSGTGSIPTNDVQCGCVYTALQLGQTISIGSARVYVVFTGEAEFCDPTTPAVSLFSGLPCEQKTPDLQKDRSAVPAAARKRLEALAVAIKNNSVSDLVPDEAFDDEKDVPIGDPPSPCLDTGSWADADDQIPDLSVRQVEVLLKRMQVKSQQRKRKD